MAGNIASIGPDILSSAIIGGLEPYAGFLRRHPGDTGTGYGFDSEAASRVERVEETGMYLGGLLMSSVDIRQEWDGKIVDDLPMGELRVFVMPPDTGTGNLSQYTRKAINRTPYPLSAVPYKREFRGNGILAEAVIGIGAFTNSEVPTLVPNAMRVEKTIIDQRSGRVVRAATLGQSINSFKALMNGKQRAHPGATLTIANYGNKAGNSDAWLSQVEALYNGTSFVQLLGVISVFEGCGRVQLRIFDLLKAILPVETA